MNGGESSILKSNKILRKVCGFVIYSRMTQKICFDVKRFPETKYEVKSKKRTTNQYIPLFQ